MNFTSKRLAYCAWAIATMSLVSIFFNRPTSVVYLILKLISIALQFVIGYAIFKNKNDKITMIVVILYAITNLSIPFGVLVVFMLLRRYAKKDKLVQNCWFVPAIVYGVLSIISLVSILKNVSIYPAFNLFVIIISHIVNILNFVILGYWLLGKLTDINKDN
ncbi:MAG: hypothetical protein NC177_18275, partial [Ruminococcus flavefaciens]|nr:hypothetical protein [Ruminococcus flavefaciens]